MLFGEAEHTYELADEWAQLPEGESFLDVGSVCIDTDDNVWVLNRGTHPVMVFNSTGERIASWGDGHFSDRPHGMGIGPDGDIYCTDDELHIVMKFTPDGELKKTLGTKNQPSETGYRDVSDFFEQISLINRVGEPFNRPTGVTVADSGEIFVADGYGNAAVHKFTPDGDHLFSWGGPGPNKGEFRLPHSIHTDEQNRIWVTDRENSRIQIFDTDGVFITQWNDLIRPTDLFITEDKRVFVTELCRRVSVFTIDGELVTRWGNEQFPADDPLFLAPHTIAVDSRNDVYVGEVSYTYNDIDRGVRMVQKFTRDM